MLLAAPSRLAVDADADLDLVWSEVEDRSALAGCRAGRERDPERACPLVDRPRGVRDLSEGPAGLGARTGDLLRQHGGAHAAASGGVERVLDGAVVVHGHARHLDAVVLGELGREPEVEHVAGVVLDDVQDARAAVDGLRGRLHLIRHGRGEDRARAGRVQHARADEAAVQGLVSRAATRDEADLAGNGCVGANDQLLVEVDSHEAGVRAGDAGERLGHDVLGIVHELLDDLGCDAHDDALLGCR